MAIDVMMKNNGDIVFGTDPDGDRLGVVVRHQGDKVVLNGNQIGVLMLYYILLTKAQNQTLPTNPLVIKSIVTTPLQNAIAEHFGATVMDTLTGFKWMAGLLRELEEKKSSFNFIFASEESFGYMPHCQSRDKDGVSSMALMAEVSLYFKLKGMTLVDALDEIYSKYGFYQESLLSLDYEGLQGSEKIKRIMHYFRHYNQESFAIDNICGKEDYLSGVSEDLKLKSTKNISLPKSDVLSLSFESGTKLFLRPSGTEPKIKFYTMVREISGTLVERKNKAQAKIKIIEKEILKICETI